MKPQTFGAWLKAKLKEHNVTQKEIAFQIAVSPNTITSWTTGGREPGIRNFFWVCKFIAILEDEHYLEIADEAAKFF